MAKLAEFYRVDNFIDTFALGHYARVLEALDRRSGQMVAFKVLRPEHLNGTNGEAIRWEYRAFANEVDLLMKLADSPRTVDLLDCGYISAAGEAPVEGEIESFQLDALGFTEAMPEFAEHGWRPYITMTELPRTNNLLYLMKPSHQGVRWRLPSEEGLALAVQFAAMLKQAHDQGIVYMDHKLEHVYWDGGQLQIIDFNSSRSLQGGAGDVGAFRTDIHNLCVGVLYPVFTGLLPQKGASMRPQPGSLPDVEARYQNITWLDFGVEPSLSPALQELLQRGAAMEIDSIEDFQAGLREVASLHGWDFPHLYTSPASRDARDQMRAGLRRLRIAHASLREARDLFREAAVLDDITEDLEDELRRLAKAVNEMLNHRIIP